MASSLSSSSSSTTTTTTWCSNVHVSREEFNLFHSIDRELYAILVINLLRDPAESMQVMALWLWLERRGFRHVIKTMLSLPHFLLNELADEAVSYLRLVSSATQTRPDIPLTQSLLERDTIIVLRSHRHVVAREVASIVDNVCVRAMGDILRQVVGPAAVGPAVPADDRTMFVTFSKGYPVFEWEVREFFTRAYGETCIESLHMQEVQGNEQSLFARIVFKKGATIDAILNGMTKAKFTINGKHVWMRKFVPKRPKSTPTVIQDDAALPNFPDSLFE